MIFNNFFNFKKKFVLLFNTILVRNKSYQKTRQANISNR